MLTQLAANFEVRTGVLEPRNPRLFGLSNLARRFGDDSSALGIIVSELLPPLLWLPLQCGLEVDG